MDQELVARYEALQRTLQVADRQLASLEQELAELRRAQATLEGLDGKQDVLMPIGGGVFLRAQVDAGAPVLSPLGSAYSADGPLEDAVARVRARAEHVQASFKTWSQRADELGREFQAVAGRLQAGEAGE